MILLLGLAGCMPSLQGFDARRVPTSSDWGPNPAPVEWWYVSGYLPEEGLAFHWAIFKGYFGQRYSLGPLPLGFLFPGPFHASHIALTDLKAGTKVFSERFDFSPDKPRGDSTIQYPPLRIEQGDWRLLQEGEAFRLRAGPLDLRLTPLKPAVVHPPGYSGTPEVGQMYYVSYTRLALEGQINGRSVKGEAWMDHQWGGQFAGQDATWDWFGLHLSGGVDLMLYRVKDRSGKVVQVFGSATAADGSIREIPGVTMTPQETWTSSSGRSYTLSWQVEGEGLSLKLWPLRQDQELLTSSTRVAYWEGPVAGSGTWQGQAVQAKGMGEFVAGVYSP